MASPLTVSLWAEAVMDAYPCWLTERLFIWAATRLKRWVWAGAPKVNVKHRTKWEAWRPVASGLTFRRAPLPTPPAHLLRLEDYWRQYENSAYRQLAEFGLMNSGVGLKYLAGLQAFRPGQYVRIHGS